MSILIKGIKMPGNCADCFALDEYGDYPVCRITGEQRGYNFRKFEKRMERCPLVDMPSDLPTADAAPVEGSKNSKMKRLSCLLGNHQYKMNDMIFEHAATDFERGIGYFWATNTCVYCGKKSMTVVEIPIQKWLYNSEKEVDDGKMD